jgi:cellulose biosynthesis protein BcsQ
VSKTTTAFNLGWAMADRGKRVLIVDGDPQCNLTGTVLGFDGVQDFSDFYKNNPDARSGVERVTRMLEWPRPSALSSPLDASG